MEKFNMDDQEYWTWVQPWVSQTITAARTPSSALKSCWSTQKRFITHRRLLVAPLLPLLPWQGTGRWEKEKHRILDDDDQGPASGHLQRWQCKWRTCEYKRQKLNCWVRWNLLGTFKGGNANGGHVNIIIKTVVSYETWADVLDNEGGAKGEDQVASQLKQLH